MSYGKCCFYMLLSTFNFRIYFSKVSEFIWMCSNTLIWIRRSSLPIRMIFASIIPHFKQDLNVFITLILLVKIENLFGKMWKWSDLCFTKTNSAILFCLHIQLASLTGPLIRAISNLYCIKYFLVVFSVILFMSIYFEIITSWNMIYFWFFYQFLNRWGSFLKNT